VRFGSILAPVVSRTALSGENMKFTTNSGSGISAGLQSAFPKA